MRCFRIIAVVHARIDRIDLAGGIGEAVVAAVVGEGEPGVVEAEQVQDRSVKVVHVDAIDLGPKADGVGCAMNRAPLIPPPAIQYANPCGLWSRPLPALGHGHSSELAAPDDQRAIEKPPPLQVLEQAGDGLVGPPAHRGVVGLDVVVCVPAVRRRPSKAE